MRFFRAVALLEGASFLVLLGIAMPLKYLADMPLAVRVVGLAHGVLFIAYVLLLAALVAKGRFTFGRAVSAFGLGFVPFGTFLLDRSLRADIARGVTVHR